MRLSNCRQCTSDVRTSPTYRSSDQAQNAPLREPLHPKILYRGSVGKFLPFPHAVFLSQVVWLELFGELACATYVPAAPDARGNGAKSKPLLFRCGVGHGWRLVGGGWPRPGPVLATQLAKFQQARGINNYRHEMLQMRFDNDCLHPLLDCLHCPA